MPLHRRYLYAQKEREREKRAFWGSSASPRSPQQTDASYKGSIPIVRLIAPFEGPRFTSSSWSVHISLIVCVIVPTDKFINNPSSDLGMLDTRDWNLLFRAQTMRRAAKRVRAPFSSKASLISLRGNGTETSLRT